MKKLIFILFFLPLITFGQVQKYYQIKSDTVRIKLKVTPVIGMNLTVIDTFGDAIFTNRPFASLDSVSIYTSTPTVATTFFCNNCAGSGITGRIVSYIGGAWRRLSLTGN